MRMLGLNCLSKWLFHKGDAPWVYLVFRDSFGDQSEQGLEAPHTKEGAQRDDGLQQEMTSILIANTNKRKF